MPQKSHNGESAPRGRAPLPDPFYYLHNFQMVLSSIERRYPQLLSEEERHFIDRFRALPRASRALLVRLVTRRGTLFRRSRVNYAEIGDTAAAAAPLSQLGWVDEAPDLNVEQLQGLLTKAEILDNFPMLRPHRARSKPELLAVLQAQRCGSQPFREWCKLSGDQVYQLNAAALCERFRLMFFGNFHQDWSELVLADLGVLAYEKIPAALQSPAFGSRAHLQAFEELYQVRQQLDGGIALAAVAERMPPPIGDCDWLEDRRQKLLFQIARRHEESGDRGAALAALADCSYRGARTFRIRLHERANAWTIARDLCLEALQSPENEAERQQLKRMLPRLNRRLGVAGTAPFQPCPLPSFELPLTAPMQDRAVEQRARDRLTQDAAGSAVYYVENGLVNSLFGLLCWKAIFAPIRGAFFHDFQHGPADLSSGQFYRRRRREFAECFAELESDRYRATIRRLFAEKAGIQCPFVDWGLLNGILLERALGCFPPEHLKLWFEWIVSDIQENRAGFPDLVQFWPRQRRYRMIEVKGPGDRLQDNQRRLLEYCLMHRMPVAVCKVRWTDS